MTRQGDDAPRASAKAAKAACRRWFASFDACDCHPLHLQLLLHPSQIERESSANQTTQAASNVTVAQCESSGRRRLTCIATPRTLAVHLMSEA